MERENWLQGARREVEKVAGFDLEPRLIAIVRPAQNVS